MTSSQVTPPLEGGTTRLFRGKRSQKDGFPQVSQLLQCGIGSAAILVHLLEKEVEKRTGKFERVRHVAVRVLKNVFLAPGIEFPGIKRVGFRQEDLRGGYNHPNHAAPAGM